MNRSAMMLAFALPLLAGGCLGSGSSQERPQFGMTSEQQGMTPEQARREYFRRIKEVQKQDEREMREAERRCRAERGPTAPCTGLIARTAR